MFIRSIIQNIFREYIKDCTLSLSEKYVPVLLGIVFPILGFFALILVFPDYFTTLRTILLFLFITIIVAGTFFRILWGYLPRYLNKQFQNHQNAYTPDESDSKDGEVIDVDYEVIDNNNDKKNGSVK